MTLRKTAWLSCGFETLLHDLSRQPRQTPFDVVIIGSGYGGSVAAAELAGCEDASGRKITVCVLERGKEYLSGMFPSRFAELPGYIRVNTPGSSKPKGSNEGLFDVRIGPDMCALVANGLGGGSLINAGVMEEPRKEAFKGWPSSVYDSLKSRFFTRAREVLGAADAGGRENTIRCREGPAPLKFSALERMSGGSEAPFRPAAITVAMRSGANNARVRREACNLCGDCATGCNHEAKESLDVGLLRTAAQKGAAIYAGATVLRIERDDRAGNWVLHTVYTDEKLRKRQGPPAKIRALKVILAAGTFGSTEILLRSRAENLRLSSRLGARFSGNGDAIAVAYRGACEVNAVADEACLPKDRHVGPTITAIIDRRPDYLIEELAIPGPLRRAFEEIVTTTNTLHEVPAGDETAHEGGALKEDPCSVDRKAIGRSSVLAMMGDDGAEGELELVGGDGRAEGDGAIRVRWPAIRDHPLFGRQIKGLTELVGRAGVRGRVLPNPLWQLLPDSAQDLLGVPKGPAFTVHPLGGCSIGKDEKDGVVDEYGRVFYATSPDVSLQAPGDLVVLDGSIVRSALGINPSLTIAALALRAVEFLRGDWGLKIPAAASPEPEIRRPVFRKVPDPQPVTAGTQVELIERMSGLVALDGQSEKCVVELTLKFEPADLAKLSISEDGRTLKLKEGKVRVFPRKKWESDRSAGADDDALDLIALRSWDIQPGKTLRIFDREPSSPLCRRLRALPAWFFNRGLRDLLQGASDWFRKGAPARNRVTLCGYFKNICALASSAGEVRVLEYDLATSDNKPIKGVKRLTYACKSNPWRQLMQMELREFPDLKKSLGRRPVLELDVKYLAAKAVPLFHILQQRDQPSALTDLASFGAYLLRLLWTIHAWSFRMPDTPKPREPQRLPGLVRGLPDPEIREIEVDRLPNGAAVHCRLTRYRPRCLGERKEPVLLIHGYSASGTTFAHDAVRPNLASHLCGKGRDVWILDLRTSCGMPTATFPWTFEDAALADIPAAVDTICRLTQTARVDVVAHCMGAAMLSMAILAPPSTGDRFYRERELLPKRLCGVVLSQVGPVPVMSPSNIARGYLMAYVRYMLPFSSVDFRLGPDPGIGDQILDRVLATLPYPVEEFCLENPWSGRTPFVGTRHRMDALYGRVFSLRNIDRRVLDRIDDLFGPMSIETVSQVINFAREQVITDPAGDGKYVLWENVKDRWNFRTLCVHGTENGLADVATLQRMKTIFADSWGRDVQVQAFEGFGHQDSLIGKHAGEVFEKISTFLAASK